MDSEGNTVAKPGALVRAETIDGLCQRYGCLPSQLMRESVEVLKLVGTVALGQDSDGQQADQTGLGYEDWAAQFDAGRRRMVGE